jgi:hypothetical protein
VQVFGQDGLTRQVTANPLNAVYPIPTVQFTTLPLRQVHRSAPIIALSALGGRHVRPARSRANLLPS